ncbi:MAG: hypothetical protein ABSG86_31700 [Thermoguttaceae bacterium]
MSRHPAGRISAALPRSAAERLASPSLPVEVVAVEVLTVLRPRVPAG